MLGGELLPVADMQNTLGQVLNKTEYSYLSPSGLVHKVLAAALLLQPNAALLSQMAMHSCSQPALSRR